MSYGLEVYKANSSLALATSDNLLRFVGIVSISLSAGASANIPFPNMTVANASEWSFTHGKDAGPISVEKFKPCSMYIATPYDGGFTLLNKNGLAADFVILIFRGV